MAIAIRGTSVTNGITLDASGNGSIVIDNTTLPIAVDDLIMIAISNAGGAVSGGGSGDLVGPIVTGNVSGILNKDADLYQAGSSKHINAWLYTKKATGGDTTFNIVGGATLAGKVIQYLVRVYSGTFATFNDVAMLTSQGSSTDLADPPAITPLRSATKIIAWYFGAQTTNTAWAAPSGMGAVLQGSISINSGRLTVADASWTSGPFDPNPVTGGDVNVGNAWVAATYAIRELTGALPPIYTYVAAPDVATFIPSADVRDSVGVNFHPNFTSWDPCLTQWQEAVIDLDAPYVRARIGSDLSVVPKLTPLFNKGIKLCALVMDGHPAAFDTAQTQLELNMLRDSIGASHIAMFEGPNEYNGTGSDWIPRTQQYLIDMKTMIRNMPAFNSISITGPSFSTVIHDALDPYGNKIYDDFGNNEAQFDFSTGHYYPVGREPLSSAAVMFYSLYVMAPTKPKTFTENGWRTSWVPGEYPTAPREPLGAFVISERAAAKYLNRSIFDYLREGVKRSYYYSIMDDVSGGNQFTKSFGLMAGPVDGYRKKKHFYALKRLLALYKDTGGAPAAGELGHTLTGTNASIHQFVAKRSNGSFLLALYQSGAANSWARFTPIGDLEPTPVAVTVNLPGNKQIEEFDPTFGATKITTASTSAYVCQVKDYPTILRISAVGTPPEEPPVAVTLPNQNRNMLLLF